MPSGCVKPWRTLPWSLKVCWRLWSQPLPPEVQWWRCCVGLPKQRYWRRHTPLPWLLPNSSWMSLLSGVDLKSNQVDLTNERLTKMSATVFWGIAIIPVFEIQIWNSNSIETPKLISEKSPMELSEFHTIFGCLEVPDGHDSSLVCYPPPQSSQLLSITLYVNSPFSRCHEVTSLL